MSKFNIRKRGSGRSKNNSLSLDNEIVDTYAFKPFTFQELSSTGSVDGESSRNEPKPRSGHRIVCDEGNFYSFGGYLEINNSTTPYDLNLNPQSNQHLFEELWKFNVATQEWEFLPTEGDIPQELASHSAVMHGNFMVVFGGTGVPFGSSSSNKMSICDLRSLKWRRITTSGQPPSPQYGQAIVLDAKKEHFYVIGGTTGYDYSLDVHKLDLSTFVWETLFITRGDSREPMPRYRHEVAFDGNYIFILGGGTASNAYDLKNIPVFDVNTLEWSTVSTVGDVIGKKKYPSSRKCQGAVQKGENVFICGGYDSRLIHADLWKLNLKSLQWTKLPVSMPLPVYFHSTSLTPMGCMLMFGGVTNVKLNQRTNRVFKIWLTVPTLKEMCWEAMLHYQPQLKNQSHQSILEAGIPMDLADRLVTPKNTCELPAPPL